MIQFWCEPISLISDYIGLKLSAKNILIPMWDWVVRSPGQLLTTWATRIPWTWKCQGSRTLKLQVRKHTSMKPLNQTQKVKSILELENPRLEFDLCWNLDRCFKIFNSLMEHDLWRLATLQPTSMKCWKRFGSKDSFNSLNIDSVVFFFRVF